eukprot:TRINITY_DN25700_c0_g1_i1.p1 TRINITY_DN25700_c0_g1~~TRINITY_DN25700_c0_g1_i1.p1  ORF type:complete len:431 (-),score=58.71 TRINITY_DN25700_c0_g1_i1:75-1271(-)
MEVEEHEHEHEPVPEDLTTHAPPTPIVTVEDYNEDEFQDGYKPSSPGQGKATMSTAYPHRFVGHHEPEREDWAFSQQGSYRHSLSSTLYLVKQAALLLFWHVVTWLVCFFSAGATLLCIHNNYKIEVPIVFLSTAVLLPMSQLHQFSSRRRNRGLQSINALKSTLVEMYYNTREWEFWLSKMPLVPANELHFKCFEEYRDVIRIMTNDMGNFFSHRGNRESLCRIYRSFDKISRIHEALRRKVPWSVSVVSRAYQFQRIIILEFERIRIIHDYRSPSSMRSMILVHLCLFPILMAPYYALLSHNHGYPVGIYISILSSILACLLYIIETQLEDPFTGSNPDDINVDILAEPRRCHMWLVSELGDDPYYEDPEAIKKMHERIQKKKANKKRLRAEGTGK